MAINPIAVDVAMVEAVNRVVEAAREKRLVLFIGAGVSRNVGFPDWKTLLTPAVDEMGGWPAMGGQSLLQVAQTYEYHCGGDRTKLRKLLKNQLGAKKALSAVHLALPALAPSLLVTTNYDRLLQDTFPDATLAAHPRAAAELAADELGIVHLHGHIDYSDLDHDGFILTQNDYDNVEQLKAPYFECLRPHWQRSLILFLGYGAGDWDVADSGRTVRAMFGPAYARRHLAIDLSGNLAAQLRTYWQPFNADVVPRDAMPGGSAPERLLNFLKACAAGLAGASGSASGGDPGSAGTGTSSKKTIDPGSATSATSLELADLLIDPAVWHALKQVELISHLIQEVQSIRTEPGFTLPDAQSLFNLIALPDTPADLLLYHMEAVAIGIKPKLKSASAYALTTAHKFLLLLGKVLAERHVADLKDSAKPLTAASHQVGVAHESEGLAALIAAMWINASKAGRVQIASVLLQDGKLETPSTINITNTALEPGVKDGIDLVKSQIYTKLNGQAALKPDRNWAKSDEVYRHQYLPAVRKQLQQGMGDTQSYDIVLMLAANHTSGHLLAQTDVRAKIKAQLGLWIVVYGCADAAQDVPKDLTDLVDTTFLGMFRHL